VTGKLVSPGAPASSFIGRNLDEDAIREGFLSCRVG